MARIPGVGDVGDVLSNGLEGLEHNFITSRVEDLVKWSRARSCWPATFGLACCAIEMMATGAAHYDLARAYAKTTITENNLMCIFYFNMCYSLW